MDPFYLKLPIERDNYICAYTGGFRSSTGIQIEQSTNQPKLFTSPKIQPEACIVSERSKNYMPVFEYPEASQPSYATIMFCSCGNFAPHPTLPLLRNWA